MKEIFSVMPVSDGEGADGITFIANRNGIRTKGVISRSVLIGWAEATNEPLLSVFLRNNDRIKNAARLRLAANPGIVVVLGSGDF
jgi:hypothetical protein